MNNKLKFLLSVIIVALLAVVVMPAIGKLIAKSEPESLLKDVSNFNNKIYDTTNRDLPPPEYLKGYGIRLYREDGTCVNTQDIKYEGKPLKLYVSVVNATTEKDKLGLMVLLDNEIISYKVDDKQRDEYFYIQELPGNSLSNIPITIGAEGSITSGNHKIWFAFINKLDAERDESIGDILNPFTLYKTISGGGAAEDFVKIRSLLPKGKVISVRSDISTMSAFNMAIDLDSDISGLKQKGKITVKSGQTCSLRVEAAGEEGTFATILFLDHKMIYINKDEKSLIWKMKKGEMLSHSFEFKAPDKPGKYEMYAVNLPIGSDIPMLKASGRFTLEVTK